MIVWHFLFRAALLFLEGFESVKRYITDLITFPTNGSLCLVL